MLRIYSILAGLVLVSGLGAGLYLVLRSTPSDQFADCRSTAIAGGNATIGGPFELTDHTGQRVTDTDVIDGPTLIYFGYTFCPDVCPLDTYRNAEAVAVLEESGISVKPVMITIDPKRDTPETLAVFVEYMYKDMVGLSGSTEDIATAIKAYRVYAAKNGDGENYLMDHSTYTYLMAPEHGFLEFFRRDVSAEDMADSVACFAENL